MHVSDSCSLSLPRWWFNEFISNALSTAAQLRVNLRYQGFRGLMRTHITLYVEGEEEAVEAFRRWVMEIARLNS